MREFLRMTNDFGSPGISVEQEQTNHDKEAEMAGKKMLPATLFDGKLG